MHDNLPSVSTLQLTPKSCDGLTGVVRDHVAACGISVFFIPTLCDSSVLTPVRSPMPDAIATVSETPKHERGRICTHALPIFRAVALNF